MINIIFSDIKLTIKKIKSSYLLGLFILSLNFLYNISSFFNLPKIISPFSFLLIPIVIFLIIVCYYEKILLHQIKIITGSNMEYNLDCNNKLFVCRRLACIITIFLLPNHITSEIITSKIKHIILYNDGIINLTSERLLYFSIEQLVSLITYILIAYLTYAAFEYNYNIKKIIRGLCKFFTSRSFLQMLIVAIILSLVLSPINFMFDNYYFFKMSERLDHTQLNHDLIEKIINIIEWIGIILKFIISTSLITLFFIYTGVLFYIKNKMMVVFDLTRPINIIIKRHKKIILSSTLLVVYLFIWFAWGVIYRDIANVSHGEEFIFQSDLLLKSQISVFKENTKSEVDDQFISDIITSKDYKNVEIVSALNASNDSPAFNTPLCKTAIGDKWANYYENMYVKKGVIGYSVSNIKKVMKDNTASYVMNLILYTDIPETSEFDYGNRTFKVSGTSNIISINGESPHIGYLDKKKTLKSVEEEVINININTTDSSLIEAFGSIEQSDNYMLNIDLKDILKYSGIYLNKDVIELKNILKGEYQYSLADFLYFSAISITTTGYGDILPNSSRVRVYVMFEILFGVTVVGIFVSSLFIKEETN